MGLFEDIYGDATAEERAEFDRASAEYERFTGQRPCPKGCGCTEFYDTRKPEEITGGFGVAGCICARCEGEDGVSDD